MKLKDKTVLIQKRLNELYPKTEIPLIHKNPYTLLVAVVLSAQSTDKKVNELTKKLFEVASTPNEMIELGENKIFKFINKIGLAKKKARYIYNLSLKISDLHNNFVPKTFTELEELPGVGHKTASVVMSQAFGFPAFPVDTHIHRLAQRWGLTNGDSVKKTEQDLKRLFPIESWNKLHLQIIFYGREYCSARGCDGRVCKLCKELYPNRKKPIKCKKP